MPVMAQKTCILKRKNVILSIREVIMKNSENENTTVTLYHGSKSGIHGAMADEICRKYRREGRFFDEIIKAGE